MNISALELSKIAGKKKVGDPYLKFQLDLKTLGLLPLKEAQEVIVIPAKRITQIPNMDSHILGLLNQRNRVFWVIDLASLLGLPPLSPYLQQYNVAIIRVKDIPLGLVIQDIKGVLRFPLEEIQSPLGVVSTDFTPYLKGCVMDNDEILLVLDPESIINNQ
jgi:positive phototaxis protein PixI